MKNGAKSWQQTCQVLSDLVEERGPEMPPDVHAYLACTNWRALGSRDGLTARAYAQSDLRYVRRSMSAGPLRDSLETLLEQLAREGIE